MHSHSPADQLMTCSELRKMDRPAAGESLPLFGLGTFRIRGYEMVYRCLDIALQHGYRLIDTASVYHNEEDIGRCLKELLPKHGLTRSDVYVTSKLAPGDQGPIAYDACLKSLERLQMDYLDLYLIHWPGTRKMKLDDPKNSENRRESWKALEKLHKNGKCRQIGISNYLVCHMEELFTYAEIKPAVNQTEYHPYLLNKDVVEWCRENGIQFQAHTSLGTGELLQDPAVVSIAEKVQHKPSQVLLKWAMQDGIGVLPMSSKPEHIIDNCEVWDWSLSEDDMNVLHNFTRTVRFAWDPTPVL